MSIIWQSFRVQHFNFTFLICMTTVIMIGLSSLVPVFSVMWQNEKHYGVSLVDSFAYGQFPEAMKAIYGVEDELEQPYVDVNYLMRQNIYEVSPTFAKLKTHLEAPDGVGWRQQPCNQPIQVCNESAAWFPWELRDAVQNAGLGETAADFERTMGMIATEIRTACREGSLICVNEGLAMGLNSLDTLSARSVVDAFFLALTQLLDSNLGVMARVSTDISDTDRSELWNSTIKGLPPTSFYDKYESNDLFLGDLRRFISIMYSSLIWVLLALAILSVIGNRKCKANPALRWSSLGFVLSLLLMLLPNRMIELSSTEPLPSAMPFRRSANFATRSVW